METSVAGIEWRPPGTQYIEVQFIPDGRAYAYAWLGEGPINIGDWVKTPRPAEWNGPYHGVGKVVRLGSGYEGPVRAITERHKSG